MGNLFSRPPQMPAIQSRPEPPVITETEMAPIEEDIIRQRRKLSRPRSIITGDLTPDTGRKGVLG